MTLTTENILLIGSVLLFISLLAGKTSARFGVPVLLLFITIGILAGSEGLGGIYFNNPSTAQFIGIIALNFILFSGGLDTDWKAVRPVMWKGISLSTIGVILTAGTVGVFVWAITDLTLTESFLLGSIVSSTDSAAVFSILRSKKLALKGHIRQVLELESGSNDPMAYVLTILFTGLLVSENAGPWSSIILFISQFTIGAILGIVFGKLGKLVINSIHLDFEGLYVVLGIAIMFFSFAFTDFIGGNGFLAVYLCGILLGNTDLIHKKKLLKSFDSFAWLMQIVMFLTLGLLVFPSQILPVVGTGLLISGFLIFVSRPFSVFLSLLPFRMRSRNRLFISWVGLRGAVPIVFATYPLIAGIACAPTIFNLVFFISLTSVLIQGTTLPVVAKWLNVILPEKLKQVTQTDREFIDTIKTVFTEYSIPPGSQIAGNQIVDLSLPKSMNISFIKRDGKYISPNGSTRIEVGDQLFILAENKESLIPFEEWLTAKKTVDS